MSSYVALAMLFISLPFFIAGFLWWLSRQHQPGTPRPSAPAPPGPSAQPPHPGVVVNYISSADRVTGTRPPHPAGPRRGAVEIPREELPDELLAIDPYGRFYHQPMTKPRIIGAAAEEDHMPPSEPRADPARPAKPPFPALPTPPPGHAPLGDLAQIRELSLANFWAQRLFGENARPADPAQFLHELRERVYDLHDPLLREAMLLRLQGLTMAQVGRRLERTREAIRQREQRTCRILAHPSRGLQNLLQPKGDQDG